MRNLKTILPMLAFVLAIGMSFAFVNATGEDYYATGYIELDNQWYGVNVDCTVEDENCKVILQGDATQFEHPVYDAPDGALLEDGNVNAPIIPDPRK